MHITCLFHESAGIYLERATIDIIFVPLKKQTAYLLKTIFPINIEQLFPK